MLGLLNDIRDNKPIRIIFDGDDFGIYEWDEKEQKYINFLGFTKQELVEIIKYKDHYVKVERV